VRLDERRGALELVDRTDKNSSLRGTRGR
jgi:hypothetical protein